MNAKLETRQTTRNLDADIQSVAAAGAPAWVAYRVSTLRGPQHMCNSNSWTSNKVMLEPATELTILVRVENRRIDRLQTVTPDCEVDAGGLPVVWLEGLPGAKRGVADNTDPLGRHERSAGIARWCGRRWRR